jgi:Sugar (and other) transporter
VTRHTCPASHQDGFHGAVHPGHLLSGRARWKQTQPFAATLSYRRGLSLASGLWSIEVPGVVGTQRRSRVGDGSRGSADGSAGGIDTLAAIGNEHRPDDLSEVFSVAGRFAIFMGIGLFFVQQFVGINAMLYYPTSSLKQLADNLNLNLSDAGGLIFSGVNVAATVVAIALVDRVGRRPLLLVSLAGVAFGLMAMAVGAGAHSFGTAQIQSAVGTYVFIVSFAVGLGPIAWVVAAEMLPIHVRGLAMGVVAASHWLFDGLASPTGLLLGEEVGRHVLLTPFAGIAVVGFVVFRRRLPETKGVSLVAIDRHRSPSKTSAGPSGCLAAWSTSCTTRGSSALPRSARAQ